MYGRNVWGDVWEKCMGETKRNFQKREFLVFMRVLGTKTLKNKNGKHPIWEYKTKLP